MDRTLTFMITVNTIAHWTVKAEIEMPVSLEDFESKINAFKPFDFQKIESCITHELMHREQEKDFLVPLERLCTHLVGIIENKLPQDSKLISVSTEYGKRKVIYK